METPNSFQPAGDRGAASVGKKRSASRKARLDQLVTDRGLAESREKAQRLIRAGRVRVNGQPAAKPGHVTDIAAVIALTATERFVSRGGEKLDAALIHFALDPAGLCALDAGASTGGFTDCLLQHGARRVLAVDVGRAQLHPRLAADPRVFSLEGVNVRYLRPVDLPDVPDVAVCDVAFISLEKVLPALAACVRPGGWLVTLIKPQFEAGRAQIERGGVVRDARVHEEVVARIRDFGEKTLGLTWLGCRPSPLKGPAGNVEFLAAWRKP